MSPTAIVAATTAAGLLETAVQLWLLLYCIWCARYRCDVAATTAGGATAGATAGACFNVYSVHYLQQCGTPLRHYCSYFCWRTRCH
jgi:hypothetical protein